MGPAGSHAPSKALWFAGPLAGRVPLAHAEARNRAPESTPDFVLISPGTSGNVAQHT